MATQARPTGITLGPLLAAGGAVLLFVSLFLDYLSDEGEGLNAWKTFVFYDIVVLFVVLISLAAAAAVLFRMPGLPVDPADVLKFAGTVGLVIMAFGVVDFRDVGAGIGAWLGTLSAIAIIAGGVLRDRVPISAGGPAAAGGPGGYGGGQIGAGPGAGPPTGGEPTAAAGQQPAADWYPDPKGEARLRYWDGTQWTDQTAE